MRGERGTRELTLSISSRATGCVDVGVVVPYVASLYWAARVLLTRAHSRRFACTHAHTHARTCTHWPSAKIAYSPQCG